jgi:hypothetical protein
MQSYHVLPADARPNDTDLPRLWGVLFDEGIDHLEQGALLGVGQSLDPLKAPHDLPAPPLSTVTGACRLGVRDRADDVVGADLESLGELEHLMERDSASTHLDLRERGLM